MIKIKYEFFLLTTKGIIYLNKNKSKKLKYFIKISKKLKYKAYKRKIIIKKIIKKLILKNFYLIFLFYYSINEKTILTI